MTQLELDYKKLWHLVRRFEIGTHEDKSGKITIEQVKIMSKHVLDIVETYPSLIAKGYER